MGQLLGDITMAAGRSQTISSKFGWYCLIPIAAASAWTFINPRVFGVPASTRNWASKSVFGERIWTDRGNIRIPDQFASRVPNLANAYSWVGLAMLVYGLVVLDVWLTIGVVVIVHGGKLWYLDRMVLLLDDMKHRDTTYASWEHGDRRSSTGAGLRPRSVSATTRSRASPDRTTLVWRKCRSPRWQERVQPSLAAAGDATYRR